jgi:ABC-type taurine transport system substrate-binding protein
VAYDKLIRLAQLIYEKTKKGEIKWEATSDGGTFQASLASYSILIRRVAGAVTTAASIQVAPIATNYVNYVVLQICNEQGQVIEELTEYDATTADFKLEELFELARRMAMDVEKALDDLIGTLEASPQRK